jgi:hypothetical protein
MSFVRIRMVVLWLTATAVTSCTAAAAYTAVPTTAARTSASHPAATSAAPVHARPDATIARAFHGTIAPIDAATRAAMGGSWRPGCPVPLDDLRLLTLTFWGFDAAPHTGHLIVHRRYAGDLMTVFRAMYDARFPIRKMEIVHEYAGDHYNGHTGEPSEDDTAAFNCRNAVGSPGAWSEHAYGRAIDVNPVENPYVGAAGDVVPSDGRPFTDRSRSATGMIASNDVVVRAFASIGWTWGGTWHSLKDYMHFSATGR